MNKSNPSGPKRIRHNAASRWPVRRDRESKGSLADSVAYVINKNRYRPYNVRMNPPAGSSAIFSSTPLLVAPPNFAVILNPKQATPEIVQLPR
jgi:hypothetical protein